MQYLPEIAFDIFALYYPFYANETVRSELKGDDELIVELRDGSKWMFNVVLHTISSYRDMRYLDEYTWRDELSKRLRRKILATGITQKDLAERIGITEVSMSRYFNGVRVPDVYTLVRLTGELGCQLSDIIDE